ncbi:MAG TPA: glycosyltransferase family 39 protein [Kiritimatiellia bacterium]|nr:glycosyltransferase family 39 protein [Kiritimatiellia bacterium]HRZ11397.1 glycosyltransferase family 39 protein [Kiritimatiellia bacterium]HSA17052.1 glycosyltransferase family 39 protein [Kiritimatiellia bacterium]
MRPDALIQSSAGKSRAVTVLFLAAGVLLHLALGGAAIRAQSAVFDEPPHLLSGYIFLATGKDCFNGLYHPPVQQLMAALPLLGLKPEVPREYVAAPYRDPNPAYALAHRFLFHNGAGTDPDRLLNTGRAGVLVFSGLAAVAIWGVCARFFNPRAAWIAFFLYILNPAVLAAASLVTTDLAVSAFFFLFFLCWGRWEQRGQRRDAVWAGTLLALALASKFTAIAALPVLALWFIARKGRLPFPWSQVGWFAAALILMLALIYRGHELPVFVEGLRGVLFMTKKGQPTFLFGRHSETGWWYYFPALFLIKTPLPLLLGLLAAASAVLRKPMRIPWYLWLPPLVYFVLLCRSDIQIGHRHLLPVYPFLFLAVGLFLADRLPRRPWAIASAALGLWYAAGTAYSAPYFLAYFNETVGGPANGYKLATDSNVDWGQGLRALRDYVLKENISGFYLSYFGTADPNAYGLEHVSVGSVTNPDFHDRDPDLRKERRALLVVSATNYQSTYYEGHRNFEWLHARTPVAVLARSLLVFDITRDADAHRQLAAYFDAVGRSAMAAIERDWAAALDASPFF